MKEEVNEQEEVAMGDEHINEGYEEEWEKEHRYSRLIPHPVSRRTRSVGESESIYDPC